MSVVGESGDDNDNSGTGDDDVDGCDNVMVMMM